MPSSRSASPISPRSDEPALAPAWRALARKAGLAPWLVAQAIATRRRAAVLPEAGGARAGVVGGASQGVRHDVCDAGAPSLRLLVAGDSSAAGVGVADQSDAVAGHLTRALHRELGRPVEWTLRARSGLDTRAVHALLRGDPPPAADVAVVITGVNDVTSQVGARRAVAHRRALADWLLVEGLARHVVFAPLPPLHRFPLLPEPLRRVLGDDARRHDLALARWAATCGNVSHLAIALDLHAGVMASDGFHPGAPVYRACGEALAAHVAGIARAKADGWALRG
ncbi:MAG: SGNH/GDSL hydrolase family protein [Caldimonas sp.]